MGLIWDLIQHGQIQDAQSKATSLESRVDRLEEELRRTLVRLLKALERRFGEDLDGDNRIG